jgi:hypothetical protein
MVKITFHLLLILLTYLLHEAESFLISSTNQKIPHILWNLKFHYRFQKCPPRLSILSQIDQVYATPHPSSWRSILILSSHIHLGLPSDLFPPRFRTKTSIVSLGFFIDLILRPHYGLGSTRPLTEMITRNISSG